VQGTDLDVEIVVVDNAKTWDAKEVALEFGARYLRNPEPGVAATRNAGVEVATGEYLTFLDDDDMWLPAHIRPHIALMQSDASLGGVMGQILPVDHESLYPIGAPFPERLSASGGAFGTLLTGGLQIGALLIRASTWDAIGPFDRQFAHSHTRIAVDDWDWYLRLAYHFPLGFVAEPCLKNRIRPPTLQEDVMLYKRQAVGRRIFWKHVRGAGRNAPSRLSATRMWLRHDGSLAGRLLNHAGVYAEQGNLGDARRAVTLAALVAPLHISWGIAHSSRVRGLLRETLTPGTHRKGFQARVVK
jgi:glycosyltransferase involved in cell wall biosynthesis